jgi:signal transduction histidine kinase
MPHGHTSDPRSQDSQRPEPGTSARDRLIANTERILSIWEERLRNDVAAAGREPQPILINTLPAVLHQLGEALSPDHPRRTATDGSTVAHEHGGERVRLTHFALEDLIAEYKILRQVLFEVLEHEEPLTREERNTLHSSLDQALGEACTGYVLVQSSLRDRFFATMAHDLRNPLNAAQAAAALVASRSPSDEITGWARRIVKNIGRVDRMVEDLLNAMRVQTGARLQLDIRACDLVEVVRHTIEGLGTQDGGRIVLVAPEPVRGFMAPDALQRAVENLLDNAVKYGDPSRPITVDVRETHGRAIVRVHNHGPHIPADKQETLFRAFQRLTDAGSSGQKGWGLGLAQVRAVAEAHGGSITVDSVPGRGTTFIVDIPVDARPYQEKPITPTRLTESLG